MFIRTRAILLQHHDVAPPEMSLIGVWPFRTSARSTHASVRGPSTRQSGCLQILRRKTASAMGRPGALELSKRTSNVRKCSWLGTAAEFVLSAPRQNKTTTPRKAGNSSRSQQLQKSTCRFRRVNISQSETALCSAVLDQSGTDAMVPLVPWPVPGHQRSDSPSESAGCLAAREEKSRKVLRNNCGSYTERRLHT